MTHDRSDLSFEYIELLVWIFFFESSLSLISIKSRRWITDIYVHCQRKMHSFQFRWIVRLNFINSNHDPKIRSTLLFNSIIGSKKIGRVDFRNAMVNSFSLSLWFDSKDRRSDLQPVIIDQRIGKNYLSESLVPVSTIVMNHESAMIHWRIIVIHVHFSFGINYTGRVCRSLCIYHPDGCRSETMRRAYRLERCFADTKTFEFSPTAWCILLCPVFFHLSPAFSTSFFYFDGREVTQSEWREILGRT